MNLLHQVLVAYRGARRKLHVHLVRAFTARRLADRKRKRQFLAMPVTGKPSTWPKLNENHSIDKFRRENGR